MRMADEPILGQDGRDGEVAAVADNLALNLSALSLSDTEQRSVKPLPPLFYKANSKFSDPNSPGSDVTLIQFHPFARLPIELRRLVWDNVLSQPRLIQIGWPSGDCWPWDHQDYQVLGSRDPPVIFHICKETREAALQVYQLLPRFKGSGDEDSVHFNPLVDIIYFGNGACGMTIMAFLKMRLNTPRIAIDIALQRPDFTIFQPEMIIAHAREMVTGMDPTISLFQFLHGFRNENEISDTLDFPGCRFLKEVFWVIRTGAPEDLAIRAEHVDSTVTLRDILDSEVPEEEQRTKRRYETQIQSVRAEELLPATEENNWLYETGSMPSFRFSALARRYAWVNPIPSFQRTEGDINLPPLKQYNEED
jgi:hypothetical protein